MFLSVCISTPLAIGFFVWLQLTLPHNDGTAPLCGIVALLVFAAVYHALLAVGRTRHPVRLCLSLLVLIIALPGWLFLASQDAWARNHGMFYDPLGLIYAAISMLLAPVTMLILLSLFVTTLVMLCCGCCECNVDDEDGTRVACCNCFSAVQLGRRHRVYENGNLISDEPL